MAHKQEEETRKRNSVSNPRVLRGEACPQLKSLANVTVQENLAVNCNDSASHTSDWNTVSLMGNSRWAQ